MKKKIMQCHLRQQNSKILPIAVSCIRHMRQACHLQEGASNSISKWRGKKKESLFKRRMDHWTRKTARLQTEHSHAVKGYTVWERRLVALQAMFDLLVQWQPHLDLGKFKCGWNKITNQVINLKGTRQGFKYQFKSEPTPARLFMISKTRSHPILGCIMCWCSTNQPFNLKAILRDRHLYRYSNKTTGLSHTQSKFTKYLKPTYNSQLFLGPFNKVYEINLMIC